MRPRDPGRTLLAAALLLAACSPWRWDASSLCAGTDPARCFDAGGACVVVTDTISSDPECIRRALERAQQYWDSPGDTLDGWLVVFLDHEIECNGAPASACTSLRYRIMGLQALDPACPETAQVVHDLGHVILRETSHASEQWCWESEQEATRLIVRAPDASPGCAASGYYTWDADLAQGCDGAGGPRRTPSGHAGARAGGAAVLRARARRVRVRGARTGAARSRASSRARSTTAAT